MTSAELFNLSDRHPNILWQDDIQNRQVKFRNERLDWYKNNPENSTAISYAKLDELTEEQVLAAIDKGYKIENYTRITGYFAPVRNFNPGKRAELRDRRKTDLEGNPQRITMPELNAIQHGIAVAG